MNNQIKRELVNKILKLSKIHQNEIFNNYKNLNSLNSLIEKTKNNFIKNR